MSEDVTLKSYTKDSRSRKIEERYAGQEAVRMNVSSDVSGSTALDASGGANDKVTYTVTLSNPYALRMFGFPVFSLFETSVATNNLIPFGSAVTPSNYRIFWSIDWQTTDAYNVKLKVFVQNLSAGVKTVLIRANFRYIIESGSVA